ncbi:hypothetical protein EC973_001667 [Apophysomyces ossiformis]|uniref:Uncharacterized protein n=1 Tax=Apophysomyces ossiformis TaxID=679940 RepID=A0A8H7ES71_9FUNG|nr:hypothetical protein EC973_001667 [Apophysomyces ossiformis]
MPLTVLFITDNRHEELYLPSKRSVSSLPYPKPLAVGVLDDEDAAVPPDDAKKQPEHPMKLKQNEYNSCYIDSVFELLMRVVLPAIPEPSVVGEEARTNDFLLRAPRKLTEQLEFVKGIETARDHVWQHGISFGFMKGGFNDPLNVLHYLFDNSCDGLSDINRNYFAFSTQNTVNKITLPKGPGTVWDAEEITPTKPSDVIYRHPLIYLSDDFIEEHGLDSLRNTNADWDTALTLLLTRQSIERHGRYSGLLEQQEIVNYPHVFFLIDPSISSSDRRIKQEERAATQLSYPKLIKIGKRMYTLIGRIVSSKAAGEHFWCVCSINDETIKVDNLARQAKVLKQDIHGKAKNTIAVIYRLLDEEHQWNISLNKWYKRKDLSVILKRHKKRVQQLL